MRARLLTPTVCLLIAFAAAAPATADERLCDSAFEDCRAPLLQLINNETQGIDVAFWFMEDSRYATALINRHRAGVPVRVIMDTQANTAYPGNKTQIASLANAGVPMREYTRDYLHWKVMLFAGQNVVQFSGANYSPNAFVPVSAYRDYVDEVIYFTDDQAVVDSFKSKYDDVWTNAGRTYTTNYPRTSGTVPVRRYGPAGPIDPELNFPTTLGGSNEDFAARSVARYNAETLAIDTIIYRIDDARHTDALLAAARRGVPIRIITEPLQYRDKTRYLHSYNIDRLYYESRQGTGLPIQIRLRAHLGLTHEKLTLLRAQALTILGSSNWTISSANSQLEHNYFTQKLWMFQWAQDHFERKWANSNPLGVAETKAFTPLPPDAPSYRFPVNAAQDQPASSVTLRWYGGPWAHLYDIYVGTDPGNLALAEGDVALGPSPNTSTTQSYTVSGLTAATTYYWRVVSKTAARASKAGPIWSFRTSGALPTAGPGDVVLYAARAATRAGAWQVVADATAAGGARMHNPNAGLAKPSAASAAPADYFEMTFLADANVPYRLWIRGSAQSNSYNNDSVYVQFSDSVTSASAPAWRIGTTSSQSVTIEESSSAGLSGWGWADNAIGGDGVKIYFAGSGAHTIRIQRREDGISIDQIILSRERFAATAPGFAKNDGTIYAPSDGSSDGGGVEGEGGTPPPPPPPPPALPDGWSAGDVGAVGAAGSTVESGGAFTVKGAGADIWGTADAFHYAFRTLPGNGEIVARVATLSGPDVWTKGGVMIRQSLAPGAAHALMLVSKSKGTAFQRRTTAGGVSTHTAGPAGTAPRFVKVARAGATITASISTDGFAWTVVGTDSVGLEGAVLVGLAVTSHASSSIATVTFDHINVTAMP